MNSCSKNISDVYKRQEHYTGNMVCSKQLFKEALGHTFDEPKRWQLHNMNEIMNTVVTLSLIHIYHSDAERGAYDVRQAEEPGQRPE